MPDQSNFGWGGEMVVYACPCGYYDTSEERLCPECGVGLLQRLVVEPVELPDPFQQALQQAVAEGLMEVTEDGKFRTTEEGRRRLEEDDDA